MLMLRLMVYADEDACDLRKQNDDDVMLLNMLMLAMGAVRVVLRIRQ